MTEEAPPRTWTEEIEISGSELVQCVKRLVTEGNVRRVVLRDAAGAVLIELPLAAGVAVGGAVALALPTLAALGAMAALLTNCKLSIVREVPAEVEPDEDEAPVEPDGQPLLA